MLLGCGLVLTKHALWLLLLVCIELNRCSFERRLCCHTVLLHLAQSITVISYCTYAHKIIDLWFVTVGIC